jgi:hypothetical protein
MTGGAIGTNARASISPRVATIDTNFLPFIILSPLT